MRTLEGKLEEVYSGFFDRMQSVVDGETGEVKSDGAQRGAPHRFACYPYVGSRYGESRKILFVGMDAGADHDGESMQSFEERRESIEGRREAQQNRHIAGTYFAGLHLLANRQPDWGSAWERFKESGSTCRRLLKSGNGLPSDNPLSYVGLTNYWKWVGMGERNLGSSRGRVRYCVEAEIGLLRDEIEAYDPEVVVFQGRPLFCRRRCIGLANWISQSRLVRVHDHPSNYRRRRPLDVASSLLTFGPATDSRRSR